MNIVKRRVLLWLVMLVLVGLTGCNNTKSQSENGIDSENIELNNADNSGDLQKEDSPFSENDKESEDENILIFRDVKGETYETTIDPDVAVNPYDKNAFTHDGEKLSYSGDEHDYMLGVDVSEHQGYIDWDKVKAEGYDFAFIRIGYRGYGKAGNLKSDSRFAENYQNASKAGLKVGVYFFAQAVNEEEALEEADFVLSLLGDRRPELPVVYDPESILDDDARTDGVSGEQFTKNTIAFCDRIKEAGYEPFVYANMLWEAFFLDLKQIDVPLWYADYEPVPQTPYDFVFWQYSNTGKVNGVEGDCDLNIWLYTKD